MCACQVLLTCLIIRFFSYSNRSLMAFTHRRASSAVRARQRSVRPAQMQYVGHGVVWCGAVGPSNAAQRSNE